MVIGSILCHIKPKYYETGTVLGLPPSIIFGSEAVTEAWAITTPKVAGFPDRRVKEDPECRISELILKYGFELELLTMYEDRESHRLVAARTNMDPDNWSFDTHELTPMTAIAMDPDWYHLLGFPTMGYAFYQFRSTFKQVIEVMEVKSGLPDATDLEKHEIRIEAEIIEKVDQVRDRIKNMIGLSSVKTEVDALIAVALTTLKRKRFGLITKPISLHLVFTGNPGTGKTTIAREIGAIYKALGFLKKGHVVESMRQHLVAEYIGQTAVKTAERVKQSLDGILFIDEAYTLAPEDTSRDFGQEAIATLIAEMENNRNRLAIIVAGYPEEMKRFIDQNPGMQSRFNRYIHFDDYTSVELGEIFRQMAEEQDFEISDEVMHAVIKYCQKAYNNKGTGFGNGRFVRNLLEKVIENHALRLRSIGLKDLNSHRDFALSDIPRVIDVKSGLPDATDLEKHEIRIEAEIIEKVDQARDRIKNMIGLSSVKTEVDALIAVALTTLKREKLGLITKPISLHLVFTGNPGTGKTTVAREIGAIYEALGFLKKGHVVESMRQHLVAEHVGQTAVKTAERVKQSLDGILFIDEAYTLAPEDSAHDFGQEAIDTLIAEMENNRNRLAVIVAGYPEEMKRFIGRNPGMKSRFNRYIHFDDYTSEELGKIFHQMAEEQDYKISDEVINAVKKYCQRACDTKGKDFGNGRFVRNLLEKIIENHALRLRALGLEDRKSLREFAVSDIPNQD